MKATTKIKLWGIKFRIKLWIGSHSPANFFHMMKIRYSAKKLKRSARKMAAKVAKLPPL